MSARPVLGVICDTRVVGTQPAQLVFERYIRAAMLHADVAALLVPALPDLMQAGEIADRLDGVLMTGSPSNVAPDRYGAADGDGPFDPARDTMATALIEAMSERSRPIFGICRGLQEINVALGGTLRRDTSESDDLIRHHAADGHAFDDMFAHGHSVDLIAGGMLAAAFGMPALSVNSVHYQGVAKLAPGLSVEATAPDGLVEAFSTHINGAPLLAVQWHPEWDVSNPDSQTYFKLLGRALRGDRLNQG
jgi:putative glutamine amidotransferase